MNKILLALAVPLVFTAAGCSKTQVDPTAPVAVLPNPVTVVTTPAPAAAPAPDTSASSGTAPSDSTKTN